jgi:hypothetical protein
MRCDPLRDVCRSVFCTHQKYSGQAFCLNIGRASMMWEPSVKRTKSTRRLWRLVHPSCPPHGQEAAPQTMVLRKSGAG